jgi:hypothetical protein
MLNPVRRFIYRKYWGILYVEHCGKIYLHKILRNTVWWALWEDLFTQNTEEYFMLKTVGRFIYTKYWGIVNADHCGKIYWHKTLRKTLCSALWEDLFRHNTEEYCMFNTGRIYLQKYCTLNTVGRFIYTKYWGILYVEHFGKIYLHKIVRNTVCWKLWEDLFTQNTEEYCMLNTMRRFIYRKYWGILYVEHCGKIYLHKILRNTVRWTLWEDLFTQNTEEYCTLNTVGRFIYTK